MRNAMLMLAMYVAATFGVACNTQKRAKPEKVAETAQASEKHAPAGVTPGTYEDWCTEHQVPESQCTLCNASLAAAFKATGDWCAEHGLPESHCRKCDPNLKIVRPPKTN